MVKVSVIIPVYNGEKYIEEAIDSVLDQTFKSFELIIVNDASEDNTKEIVDEKLKLDKRIKFINCDKNKGKATVLNLGIKKSSGEYISILDADDMYFSDKLEKQVEYLDKHPEIDMVYGGAKYFGEKSEKEQTEVLDSSLDLRGMLKKAGQKTLKELNSTHHAVFEGTNAIIAACSVMIRKKVFEKCKFDENLRNIEDYDMWYQIIGKGFKIKSLNEPFYYYRIHENQKSSSSIKRQLAKDIIFHKILTGEYFKNVSPILEELKLKL